MNPPQNAMTVKPNPVAIYINEANLPTGVLFKNRALLRNVKCWHKFIVSNTDGFSRDEILQAILDHVHPLDLIPVFFAKDPTNSNSYFLARNCETAVDKLCKGNLLVNPPCNNNENRAYKPFKLTIILNFANTSEVKIDVQKNVTNVLANRFDVSSKTLDLDSFSKDPDLTEFCPLSQPKIMYFVLHIAKGFFPEEIILSNNNIKLLNPLDVLMGSKLRRIDLSNNKLTSFNDIGSLKNFNIKDLKLTGNPLCNCDEEIYISEVRSLCPTVELLDGILINLDKFAITKKYSFCDLGSTDLVNQFLEYFFTVYDNSDRRALAGLYHSNAMFSLTCVYLAGQLSSGAAYLKLYSNISRNIKKAADLSRTSEYLFRGREHIMDVFSSKLPLTEHDPYSFTADLMYRTEDTAVIVVTGVFHEKPTSLLDQERFLGFTRSFALKIHDSKCVITNDLLHVYNGLTYQEKTSFLEAIEPNKIRNAELIPKPLAKSDYTDLVTTVCHLTNLKEEWSRKCLEEYSYDLKATLEFFVELYKADKIPAYAFNETSIGPTETQTPTFYPKSSPKINVISDIKIANDGVSFNNPPMYNNASQFMHSASVMPSVGDTQNFSAGYRYV